jgi:hypothetical protein
MFSIILEEAVELNDIQSKTNESNPILQTITLILAENAQKYNIVLNEDWFNEFCNAYHDMDALSKKDKQLKAFIFERFLQKYEIIPKKQVNIQKHPGTVKIDPFEFEGAKSLKISF